MRLKNFSARHSMVGGEQSTKPDKMKGWFNMALKITDLKIDPLSLGGNFLLVDIRPVFAYVNGEKTNNIDGYRYQCCLPKHKMEKIGVRVTGKVPLFDLEKEEIPINTIVDFEGLEVGSYFSNGQINVNAKADSVSVVD